MITRDLQTLNEYYARWRLCPNPTKTEVAAFHLSNSLANREANVTFCGTKLRHNPTPKYLGVTLDRSLTYKPHLESLGQKVKTRVNLINKLAGTSWGAKGGVLRTSSLALVYSAAEYGAPVWYKSAHTSKVDVHLNRAMRTITGNLLPTPSQWLPVLSHIAPPELRRACAASREWEKAQNSTLPIRKTLDNLPNPRLRSRRPFWSDHQIQEPYCISTEWQRQWDAQMLTSGANVSDPNKEPPGFNDQRKIFVTLNRIRTGVGRCNYNLCKWGYQTSACCDCGAPAQTVAHIVKECPRRRFSGTMDDLYELTDDARD